jgi:hypothetical protein
MQLDFALAEANGLLWPFSKPSEAPLHVLPRSQLKERRESCLLYVVCASQKIATRIVPTRRMPQKGHT